MIKQFLHIGISVKDLKASAKFYTEVMQMEFDYRTKNQGDIISRVVGVEDAVIDVITVQKSNLRIELLDYKNSTMKTISKYQPQDHPGLVHIAFLVEDVDAEYERIKSLGYEFNSHPMVARENGPKIAYFKGPDNVTIEIFEKV